MYVVPVVMRDGAWEVSDESILAPGDDLLTQKQIDGVVGEPVKVAMRFGNLRDAVEMWPSNLSPALGYVSVDALRALEEKAGT